MSASTVLRSCSVLILAALPAFAGHRYEIEVTAEPAHARLVGTVRLTYRNNAGYPLAEVPVRGTATISHVLDSDQRELRWTGSAVRLNAALEPGQETVLLFKFESRFPVGQYGYRLVRGAWHPKAQTFQKGKFNPSQEQADDYDLRMLVPADQVVALPGRRLEDKPLPDGRRRLRTVLEKATSLGLAMSPQFAETVRTAAGVQIRSYRLEHGREWGVKLADLAADIVPFYTQLTGFYPHPSLVILPGARGGVWGGTPAATGMVAIHDLEGTHKDFPTWILAHEIGHQYWGYDTVIDDGDYFHWPGIPMGIWMDRQYMEARGLGRKRHDAFLANDYLPALYAGRDTTLRRTWKQIDTLNFDFNNAVAHGKAYTVIQMLEELMGPARFRQFALKLLKDYRFRFLSHEDFEKAAAEVHRDPLDWFFRDWLDADRKLSYEITEVKHENRRATVRIRQTGDARLPLPIELKASDGRGHRLQLERAPGEQSLSIETGAPPVRVMIDPDGRFPLYSPGGLDVWGKKVEVTEIRWPESFSWGTNQVRVGLRNTDDRPRRVTLNVGTRTRNRGWYFDTEHDLKPGEEITLERDFNVWPFPGSYTARLVARDTDDGRMLKLATTEGEFKPGNKGLAPLRVRDRRRESPTAQREYPRFRLLAGTNVFLYYLDGDRWLEQHAPELLAERERYFKAIRARINPSYENKITVLLFPDAESKQVWTGHTGMGWALSDVLVEIRNAKERVDPAHELVHAVAQSLGDPPAVFSEGLAVYFQEGQHWNGHHVDAWCKAFASAGLLWPLERIASLSDIGPGGTQPQITYPQAGSMVKFLVERVGFEKFLAAYREMGAGGSKKSRDEVLALFQQHFGMDLAKLEREWRDALTASDVQPVPEDALAGIKEKLISRGSYPVLPPIPQTPRALLHASSAGWGSGAPPARPVHGR